MVKKTYTKNYNEEPEQQAFDKPSEREHLFQVVEVYTHDDNPFEKGLPVDTVTVKLEVCGGEEEGRTILQRLNLDEEGKGFWATRIFLKAIGETYKGDSLEIDSDRWIGRQFYATVVHNGKYANISEFNFDKVVEQYKPPVNNNPGGVTEVKDIAWGDV